jgi:hypothetical protein
MELKRAAELCICSLLTEALSDLTFYSSQGGGDDITPIWEANHAYSIGDVLRPTNLSFVHAVVITYGGNSGSTQPSFTDVLNSTYTGGSGKPNYLTTHALSVSTAVDSGTPMPPFGVVWCDLAEKMMSQEETDYIRGSVVWVTRADATNIVTHSKNAKRIYDALTKIGSGYDILRRLTVHGVDVSATSEFTDEDRQAHGDTVSFSMAVTEKLFQAD